MGVHTICDLTMLCHLHRTQRTLRLREEVTCPRLRSSGAGRPGQEQDFILNIHVKKAGPGLRTSSGTIHHEHLWVDSSLGPVRAEGRQPAGVEGPWGSKLEERASSQTTPLILSVEAQRGQAPCL